MKNFNYNGNGTLAFTHQEMDFVIHQSGPHLLPEENELVQSLVKQELLTEVQLPHIKKQRVFTTNNNM